MADGTHSSLLMAYVVQEGDTLWAISGGTVSGTRETIKANPQIEDPDDIRPGQIVMVPITQGLKQAARQDESLGSLNNPVSLSTPAAPPGDEAVGEEGRHACKPYEYVDIVYITGTREFYLLTEETSGKLHEAQTALASLVEGVSLSGDSSSARASAFKQLNDQCDLLSAFVPASLDRFYTADNRERIAEIQAEIEQRNLRQAESMKHAAYSYSPGGASTLGQLVYTWVANHFSEGSIDDIRRAAQQRAEEAGYTIDGDGFYGPYKPLIQQALEAYRANRKAYFQGVVANVTHQTARQFRTEAVTATDLLQRIDQAVANSTDLEDPARVIQAYKDITSRCENGSELPEACTTQFGTFSELLAKLESQQKAYIDAIIQLADLGIAMPELALSTSGNAIDANGRDRFKSFNKTLIKLQALSDYVHERLEDWALATNRATELPLFVFEDARAEYRNLKSRLDRDFQTAKQNVATVYPRRTLVWHTDIFDERYAIGYTPQRLGMLVKQGYPLREFTSPKLNQALGHVSVTQLPIASEQLERMQANLYADHAAISPANPFSIHETALSDWLMNHDAFRVGIQDDWFDEAGLFKADQCVSDIKEMGFTECFSGDVGAWKTNMQRILFSNHASNDSASAWQASFRLFDASPQAQYARLLGMSEYGLDSRTATVARTVDIPGRNAQSLVKYLGDSGSGAESSALSADPEADENALDTVASGEKRVDKEHSATHEGELHGDLDGSNMSTEAESDGDGESASIDLYQDSQSIDGEFNLAKGTLTLPSVALPQRETAEQHPFRVSLMTDSGREQRSFGFYNLEIETTLTGVATVSYALSSSIGLTLNAATGGVSVGGIDYIEGELGAQSSGEAFAGASVTAEMCVSLNWCPPADLQDQLPVLNAHQRLLGESDISLSGWRPLAVAKLAGEASWGVGVSFDFGLIVRNGRFHFRFKLKAVMGEGMGGSVDVELDLDRLDIWLLMVNQAVLDSADDTLEWVQPEARSALAKIGYFIVTAGFEVAALLAHNLQALDDAYDRFTTPERSGIIAYQIVSDDSHDREFRAWVIRLLPEALGALLETLISRSHAFSPGSGLEFDEEDALFLQQQAVVKIMEWLIEAAKDGDFDGTHYGFEGSNMRNPAQRLFRNAVISMRDMDMYAFGIDPDEVAPGDISYGSNIGRMDGFIDRVPSKPENRGDYTAFKRRYYVSKNILSGRGV